MISKSSSKTRTQQTAMHSFAELLGKHLRTQFLSELELAQQIKVRRATVSRWLSGEVNRPRQREDVLRCAEFLELSPPQRDELLIAAGFNPERVASSISSSLPLSIRLPNLDSFEHSPFIIGPPITEPRQFFGREYLLKRIFSLWKGTPFQHAAIIGAKRSGKTSLLHYVRRIVDTPSNELRAHQRNDWLLPGYQWVFIDFQDPRMHRVETLLRHILLELDLPIPEPCDLISFAEIINQYVEIPTLFLFDEIGAAFESEELYEPLWWTLRSLGSNHNSKAKIGFLIASHQSPDRLIDHYGDKPSPFLNIFGHSFELGALTQEESLELIGSSPIPFSESDVAWMLEQSQGWPSLLQILCHTRLTALEEGRKDASWQKEALRRMHPYLYLLSDEQR